MITPRPKWFAGWRVARGTVKALGDDGFRSREVSYSRRFQSEQGAGLVYLPPVTIYETGDEWCAIMQGAFGMGGIVASGQLEADK